MKKLHVIGVSGLLGSGKSTLCRYLNESRGWGWIEADTVVRERLYKKGQPGYEKIKSYFGSYYVGETEVLRGRLRRLVLHNQQKLWILNQLIHPLIFHEVGMMITKFNKKPPPALCIEAIYFEPTDLGKFIDELVVVESTDVLILERLKEKGMSRADASAFIKIQKKSLPQWGTKITNFITKEDLFDQADRLIQ